MTWNLVYSENDMIKQMIMSISVKVCQVSFNHMLIPGPDVERLPGHWSSGISDLNKRSL